MANHAPNIQLLQASVSRKHGSDLRLLIDDKYVKYIAIDGGLYDVDDMCFGPSLVALLPPLPPADMGWKTARIARDATTGQPRVVAISNAPLAGIARTWHPTMVDHLELRMGRELCSNVYEATCPGARFGDPATTVVVKLARFPWEIPHLEAETAAYEWIEGHQIGPAFLGHLTEEGRVIGFVMAHVAGARHATVEDESLCRRALSKLHRLGIRHGDTHNCNFLVRGGRATLIDFESASRGASADALDEELRHLADQL